MSNAELKAALSTANTVTANLEAEKAALAAQVAELQAQLAAAPAKTEPKSHAQAKAALALLEAGPVTLAQLAEINPKYPNDPIYFVRTILKVTVNTHRVKGGATTYSLPTAPKESAALGQPVVSADIVPAAVVEAAVEPAVEAPAAQ